VIAPQGVRARRAVADRFARLRNLTGDPIAPFLEAPCEQETRDPEPRDERAEVAW